jgi:hypothetical protein
VSSVKGATAINLISGKRGIVLINALKPPDPNDLSYAFGNYWIKHGVSPRVILPDSLDRSLCGGLKIPGFYCRPTWRGGNILVTFDAHRVVLLRDERFYKFHSRQPIEADIIVITRGISVHPDKIVQEIQTKMVIIDGSVKRSGTKQWKKECEKIGLACHVISEQGSFRITREPPTIR